METHVDLNIFGGHFWKMLMIMMIKAYFYGIHSVDIFAFQSSRNLSTESTSVRGSSLEKLASMEAGLAAAEPTGALFLHGD